MTMGVKMNRTAIVGNPITSLIAQRLLLQRRLARVQHRISLLSSNKDNGNRQSNVARRRGRRLKS
jgi:hypothetical protein